MSKQYSDLWYYELMGDGEPAREFSSAARVWSEMAVRTIIIRALRDDAVRREEVDNKEALNEQTKRGE